MELEPFIGLGSTSRDYGGAHSLGWVEFGNLRVKAADGGVLMDEHRTLS